MTERERSALLELLDGAGLLRGPEALYLSLPETVDSSNSECLRLLRAGAARRCLVLAETQTAGRGRQGKRFYSPPGAGLYFSLGYAPAGHLHKCGYKFGRWYDLIWMEKIIGPHGE